MKSVAPKKSRIMVFAGAGASASLGMPTTPQFISLLKTKWKGAGTLLSKCREHSQAVGDVDGRQNIDSEVLRDWLIRLRDTAEDLEVLLQNQPFETNLQSQSNAHALISKIIMEFDLIIRNTYGDRDSSEVYRHYAPLLSTLSQYRVKFIPFFTTNYDLILESLAGYTELEWYIETGIGKKGISVNLDEQRFVRKAPSRSTIHLFKLHGSTDWWRNNNTNEVEHIRFGILPGDEYKDLLIYPTREKFNQVEEEPFSFFYDMLKGYLNLRVMRLCIVIGYSFRDKIINKLFTPALKKGLRLLVFDNNIRYEQLEQRLNLYNIERKVRIENIDFGNWNDTKVQAISNVLGEELKNNIESLGA